MLIYRLENKSGQGPFETRVLYEFMSKDVHSNPARYPSTDRAFMGDWEEFMNKPHGCKTLRELLYWFPANVIKKMRQRGFGVAVYQVDEDDVIFGKFQVVFDPTYAARLHFK